VVLTLVSISHYFFSLYSVFGRREGEGMGKGKRKDRGDKERNVYLSVPRLSRLSMTADGVYLYI
jgi:hypothetical protein